jgi:BirA family transcriptional regulator, biotin operon repressor / biotin---[acetyl-CoA-carboxylase] ligase
VDSLDLKSLSAWLETSFVGRRLVYRRSTASTQDLARQEAEEGAPQGTLVIADEQTAGRGRQGRTWVSPPASNLYFTLVLRPSPQQLSLLSMLVPLAVAEGIEATTPITTGIKWPNDVMVNGKKLSGILIDSQSTAEATACLVGVGINVNFDPRPYPEIADIATSIKAETGSDESREAILAAVLNAMERHYLRASKDPSDVFERWKGKLVNLQRHVIVHDQTGARIEGFAESVTNDGSLILLLDDGSRREFSGGQIFLP